MKVMSPEALEALAAGRAVVSGSVRFDIPGDPIRVWGGHGEIEIEGEAYVPLGDHGLIRTTAGSVGTAAQGMTLELSGIPTAALSTINARLLRGVGVVVRRLIFDQHGRDLLDVSVHARGRVDHAPKTEAAGDTSVIAVTVHGSARGLGRKGGRMRSDADQRLILSTDGGLKHISYAGERTLYWGGKPPQRAGSAIPNSGGFPGGDGSLFRRLF